MKNMQRNPDLAQDSGVGFNIHIALGCLEVGAPTHDTSDIAPVCGLDDHLIRPGQSEGEDTLFIKFAGVPVKRVT